MTRKRPASPKTSKSPRKRAAEHPNEDGGSPALAPSAEPEPETTPPDAAVDTARRSIVIEIDPAVTGGYVYDRFDVMIRGRAVSAAPIEEVRLEVDGAVICTASYGQPERAASTFMPDGTAARQRGFQFNLPRPGDGRVERCAFQIIARTEDGFEYAEKFEIELDPTAGDPVAVVSGPARSMPGGARPYTVMYVERATIDPDGMLAVHGWAVSLRPRPWPCRSSPTTNASPRRRSAVSVRTSPASTRPIRMPAWPGSA